MDEKTYQELIGKPRLRFIATGNTYPYREILTSWAWHWNSKLRLWINENETSKDDPCIQAITELSDVKVTEEGPAK